MLCSMRVPYQIQQFFISNIGIARSKKETGIIIMFSSSENVDFFSDKTKKDLEKTKQMEKNIRAFKNAPMPEQKSCILICNDIGRQFTRK